MVLNDEQMYKFVLISVVLLFSISFLPPGQGSGQFKEVVLYFDSDSVGLYEWKQQLYMHPILTNKFKDILRTFENEILKIFKNIQPRPKN